MTETERSDQPPFAYPLLRHVEPLFFSISLLFSFSDFPCFFCVCFPSFSNDFRGSAKRKSLVFFFRGFPSIFPNKARVGGSGSVTEFFAPHRAPVRELSEFLSAYYLCAKANSPSFSQNSPSLPQNSVGSLFRNSTLETVFRPFTSFADPVTETRSESSSGKSPGNFWKVLRHSGKAGTFQKPCGSPTPSKRHEKKSPKFTISVQTDTNIFSESLTLQPLLFLKKMQRKENTPKSKKGKTHKKETNFGNEKSKEIGKGKNWRVRDCLRSYSYRLYNLPRPSKTSHT